MPENIPCSEMRLGLAYRCKRLRRLKAGSSEEQSPITATVTTGSVSVWFMSPVHAPDVPGARHTVFS